MTVTQMEYLIAVDTYRNFASAAKHCYVTQPTLSMQIKKVEEELNVLIFDRSKKPVLTTDVGRQIIAQARIAVNETNRIFELINNQKDEIKGELRIGIIPTISPYLLPLFIADFMHKYPGIDLIIDELVSEQIIQKLNNDTLDAAILVTPINEASIVELPLFYERFLLYISEKHPLMKRNKIDYSDIDTSDIWLLKEGNCFRNQVINMCGDHFTHKRHQLRFEGSSLETIKRIVDSQYGFTIMPELSTLEMTEDQKHKIRSFPSPEPVREVSLIVRRSFMKRKLLTLLQEEIIAHIPKTILKNDKSTIISWRS